MSSSGSDHPACSLTVLGRPAALVADKSFPLPEKGYALVAILAFAEGRALGREDLRELLWEDASPERRSGNLRQLLLRLDRLTGDSPLVAATADGRVRLAADRWRIDVVDLLAGRLPDEAGTPGPAPLLDGIAVDGQGFEDWLAEARDRANEARIATLRGALDRQPTGTGERASLARRLVACDPHDEFGYRALMAAHAAAGDMREARRWWLEALRCLHDDLGVRPCAETRALAVRLGLEGAPALPRAEPDPAPRDPLGIPTVVVMPPAMLPGNELLDRFGLVVLEEITLGLSQFGSFRVIAAYTSWQLSRRDRGGAGLDAVPFDYGVTVGIRNSHEPLCATCRLTRLTTGQVLWTAEMEVRADNLQASLNELVRKTVNSLASALERAEGRQPAAEQGATGYRLYLEGKRSVGATGLESLRAARKWFRAAVQRCDEFASAFAGLSRTLSMEWLVRGMTDRDLLDDALAAARRAHACDPGSGRATRELGFTSLYLHRHDESLAHFAEARSLAPHDADLLADYADALMHSGQADMALEPIRAAKALNPLGPEYYRWIEASILYQLGEYEEAMQTLEPLSDSPAVARLLAASAAMADDLGGARRHADRVRANYPGFRTDDLWQIIPNRRPDYTRHVIAGLEKAGLN